MFTDIKEHQQGLFFGMLFHLLAVLDLVYKDLGRLKAWNKMFINDQRGVAGNVSGYFLFPFLVDKAAKATDIYVMAV